MKKEFFTGLAAGIMILLLNSINVFASTTVDTGTPKNMDIQWSFHSNSVSEVWLAGQFTLNKPFTLTEIKTYLTPRYAGAVTVAVYEGGDVPQLGSSLFSDTFQGMDNGQTSWYGLSNLNWTLSSGTYWVAFEAREKDNYYSTLPSDVPSPLDAYASYNPSLSAQYILSSNPDFNFGIKIIGNPVPIPSAVWLLGSGIVALAYSKRRTF